MTPKMQTALVIRRGYTEDGLPLVISHSAPVPDLASHYHVLVRVLAVALNPNDHKMMLHFPIEGNTGGCDFCGLVDAAGESSAHAVGTRVCGAAFPYKPGDTGGSFAQYLAVDSRLLVQVPESWDDMQGAAFGGVGWSTLSMAFSDSEALALSGTPDKPVEKRQPVLVYGAATATGTLACQLLSLSGYDAVAVTSTASAALARSYGAGCVASYNNPSRPLLDQIRALTSGSPIRLALDCITDTDSAAICFQAIARSGGRYACLEQCPEEWRSRQAVQVKEVMGFEVLGVDVDLGPNTTYSRKASSRLHQIGMLWASHMQQLAQEGLIMPHPLAEVESASRQWWDAVTEGLGRLQRGEVRGQKLVVRISAS
ncbi:putative alcohol dehydrogenase [Xylaria acuta]|nr:putative alcohol dehydrogenase [Xylaria acuta]